MQVFQLSDELTSLSQQGLAQEEIVISINGQEYHIKGTVNQDGELKLIAGDIIGYYNEIM